VICPLSTLGQNVHNMNNERPTTKRKCDECNHCCTLPRDLVCTKPWKRVCDGKQLRWCLVTTVIAITVMVINRKPLWNLDLNLPSDE
jgi:hypothetical protein